MSPQPLGPLAGRRVLELVDASGAYCGKLLADMGADVIKIEPPGGEATREIPPFYGGRRAASRSFFFLYMNTSKRSVTLDLGQPRAREILRRLAAGADLLLESLPPGQLDAWGLGYSELAASNPRLVFTSITAFGQTGPYRDFRSCDLVASALGGAMHLIGEAEDPPVKLAGSQAYATASTWAAVSSLIALYHSAVRGEGQRVDISLHETMVSLTHVCGISKWRDDQIVPRRSGATLFASVPSGSYRCRDGLVYLMVNRPLHWKALAQWVHEETGNREILDPIFEGASANRQPYRELLDLFISELMGRFCVDEVYHEGQRRHIAITPVQGAEELTRDPQLAARDYFVEVDLGAEGALRMPGAPFRLTKTPWQVRRPAPAPGEHNHEIYLGELGLSEAELRGLEREGVI